MIRATSALGLILLSGLMAAPLCAGPASKARFENQPCWFPVPEGRTATCGAMHVPENRSAVQTRNIRLPVVILHAPSPGPPAPVVILGGGGPGSSVMLEADDIQPLWRLHDYFAFSEGRDVYISHFCADTLMDAFLASPRDPPPAHCVAEIEAPHFVTLP